MFQRKQERSSKFNLNKEGSNEEEVTLTHYGQAVGDMERFDDMAFSDGDEDMKDGERIL